MRETKAAILYSKRRTGADRYARNANGEGCGGRGASGLRSVGGSRACRAGRVAEGVLKDWGAERLKVPRSDPAHGKPAHSSGELKG